MSDDQTIIRAGYKYLFQPDYLIKDASAHTTIFQEKW